MTSHSFWDGLYDMNKPILPKIIPKDVCAHIIKVTDWQMARIVSEFLAKNFGNPPKTPVLQIPPSELYENSAHTFVWISDNSKPLGSIRYRPWSKDNKRIYWQVDCFCVEKDSRSKGIGTWLLKYLHSWANSRGIPYAMFIKEGAPLVIPRLPFKTGVYAFIDIGGLSLNANHGSLKQIPVSFAEKWVRPQASATTTATAIFPYDSDQNYTSFWYLYKSNSIWLVIRAEKTNQVGPTGHLGWLTNIYESPSWKTISFQEQTKYITNCTQLISKKNNWGSVWIDSSWVEISEESPWKLDGPYFLYSFQW
jgi:GNAT superfamily N-acetyltransferase